MARRVWTLPTWIGARGCSRVPPYITPTWSAGRYRLRCLTAWSINSRRWAIHRTRPPIASINPTAVTVFPVPVGLTSIGLSCSRRAVSRIAFAWYGLGFIVWVLLLSKNRRGCERLRVVQFRVCCPRRSGVLKGRVFRDRCDCSPVGRIKLSYVLSFNLCAFRYGFIPFFD